MLGSCEHSNKLALDLFSKLQEEQTNGRLGRKKLIWLELTGCSGDIISLLNAQHPGFGFVVTDIIDLVYNNSLSSQMGESAMDELFKTLESEFILAVEGAVSTRDSGSYNYIGMRNGKRLSAFEAARLFGERATHVFAVGTCATDGGISAARPNPSGSVPLSAVLTRQVINLPGCPCNPSWFLTALAHLLLFGPPELDDFNRPVMLYGISIHDRCERRSFFDRGIFASTLGEPTCMFKLGCRGPVTFTDCPIRRWNERVNWPVMDDTPCIGCAQTGFPDLMEPFITFDTTQGE